MTITTNILIPFSGFYDSIHDGEFDSQLENYLEENELDYGDADVNWTAVRLEYSQEYAKAVSELDDTLHGLEFKELISPREYNFSTDKIECTIPMLDLLNIYTLSTTGEYREEWIKYVHDKLKGYDGFMPFYSNDYVNGWPTLLTQWEEPQADLLLEFYIKVVLEELNNQMEELEIMESFNCSGGYSLVENNIMNV